MFPVYQLPISASQLIGAECISIGRHGKYLLFGLRSGSPRQGDLRFLIIHLRMTGRLFLVPASEAVIRSTGLSLILDQGLALRFDDPRKFGRVWLVDDPGEIIGKLGPARPDGQSFGVQGSARQV